MTAGRLGACILAALLVAGCGHSGSHATGAPRRTRSATSATTSAAGTSATSATTTSSSSTASLPGSGRPTVTIGDKNYTEQFVLGQLYLQALRSQGFTVEISQNIGPPAVFTRALKSGTLAMYPEYLDTFDDTIAHARVRPRTPARALVAGRRWAARHGLRLLAPTPFSDTGAIATTVAYATRHRLRSLVDLRRVGDDLVIGGAAPFQTHRPGLPSLSDVYGVAPATFKSLAVGDQYDDLDDGTIDAAYVTTTDGQLTSGDYRVLADPDRVFGFGNVVPVASAAALAKEGPAFARTIERVDRTLTTATIRRLNFDVDIAKQDPSAVAKQYLETHGLLGPAAP